MLSEMRLGLRRLSAMTASLAVLLIALFVPSGLALAAEPEPRFCRSQTLHDYLAPLKRMPKLRELPYRARGEGRFRGARVGASGPSLAISGGSAGYQLQWDDNPKWDITVTLARVNWRGKVVQQLGQRHVRLGQLAPAVITEPHFALPGKPGAYRSTLVIRSSSGRKLAEFGNYYRVIRPTVHNRLATDASAYRPGSTLFARLENPGATIVLFGEEFFVEKLEGEEWVPLPGTPFPTGLRFVAAGTTSNHCTVFPIPDSTAPGKYRLSQEAVISWASLDGQIRPILHAEFEVVP
jgi:Big-like domain-containing protein